MDKIGPFIPIDFVTYVQYNSIREVEGLHSVVSLIFQILHAMAIYKFRSSLDKLATGFAQHQRHKIVFSCLYNLF